MDSLELNKIVAALLTAGVVAMTAGFVGELLVKPKELEENVYQVVLSEGTAGGAEAAAAPTLEAIGPLLAAADVAAGEKGARKCAACHTFEEGGAKKIGPNLWNIVDRSIASDGDFAYSDALKGMSGEAWTYENLSAFLTKPKDFAPGTKMSFAGVKKIGARADLIAYLRGQSGSPAALPE
jgi:cytochrome c